MNENVGTIVKTGENYVVVVVPTDVKTLEKQKITKCRVQFDDARTITAEQRKKAYAIIGDISEWSGEEFPEMTKQHLKNDYIVCTGEKYFSLSDCSITTARKFINFLIDFCFYHNVPTTDVTGSLLYQTDDIGHYLYSCLWNRKCAVCNAKAEIHHCEGSRVGMGFNRNNINNIGRKAIALCRKHHAQAHNSEKEFFSKYHIYGITLDAYLVRRLKL